MIYYRKNTIPGLKKLSEALNVSRHRKIDFESQIWALFDCIVHKYNM